MTNDTDKPDYSGKRVLDLIITAISFLLAYTILYIGIYNDYFDQFKPGLERVAAENLTSWHAPVWAFLELDLWTYLYGFVAATFLWGLIEYLIKAILFNDDGLLRMTGYYSMDEIAQAIADDSPDGDQVLSLYNRWKVERNLKQFMPTNDIEEAVKVLLKKRLKLYMLSYAIKGVALIIGFYFIIDLLYQDNLIQYYLNN